MTTKDTTGDKLVASIRRTKAGSTKPAESAETPSKPAPTPKASATTKRRTPPAKAPAAQPATGSSDPYQGARRVWPD